MQKIIYADIDSAESDGLKEMEIPDLNWAHGADIHHLQVLKSAAGYYIGTLSKADWYNPKPVSTTMESLAGQQLRDEFWEPYSRDSECYWGTREEAEEALRTGNYPVKF